MDTAFDTGPWIALAIEYGPRILGALIFLIVAWILAGWTRRIVRRALERTEFDATLTIFFAGLARWGVLILAILACLGLFGIQTTSFAAVIGAGGLAIGLAFQGTLSNFSSGVMLLAFRPFEVGDFIKAAGVSGTVKEIQLFYTTLDTPGNERIFVPNEQISGGIIENFTHHDVRRVAVDVGADYGAPIDDTRAVLEKAVASVE
ncbi:MAG: mechanosensitive ion channel family protein, partial [Acidobacteriota bacterium]